MNIFNFIILFFVTFITINFVAGEDLKLTAGPVTCEYKNKDTSEDYDANSDNSITCDGTSCNGKGATFSDGLVTITAAGTYIIQGTLNGQIRIEAAKEDFIHLVLNSVTINSSSGPAIYGISADKITITIIGENTLVDSNNYTVVDEEPDACLFIDSDLSFNGSGSLSVTGNYGDAIRCKKDLKFVSGNILVPSAVQRGIKAKNSICIKDGTIDVTSSNTAIKVTRDDDAEKGYIVVDGGNIAVSSGKDGIHSETHLTIRGGYIDIKKSTEGLEGQMIDIIGGEIHVLASDDGINASKITNNTETSNNGGMGGFGGMPGDSATVTDGSVYINIVGGKTYVTVDGNDVDGIDSNGVLYIGGEAEVYASISGGDIYGNMAALDAEGSNSIAAGASVFATSGNMGGGMGGGMSGGSGGPGKGGRNKRQTSDSNNSDDSTSTSNNSDDSTNTSNNSDDSTSTSNNSDDSSSTRGQLGEVNSPPGGMNGRGGMGGIGGMGETGSVYQPYIQTSVDSQNAGTEIIVKDSSGNVLAKYTPSVSYSTILVSLPSLKAGESYTIVTGENSVTATASEAASGEPSSPSVKNPSDTVTSNALIIHPNIVTLAFILLSILLLF